MPSFHKPGYTPDCFNCPIKNCSIIKNCNKQSLTLINESKKFVHYRGGEYIVREGMELEDLYFVFDGKLKVTSTGLYGKQQIKRLAKTGDFVGFRGLVNDHPMSASVIAFCDTYICSISKSLFVSILKENPELLFNTFMFVMEEFYKVENRMKNLTTMNVREKTAESLLFVFETFGNRNSGEIEVDLSRQELADIAMTTKEQISKCLSEFAEEGKIEMEKKKIFLLDIPELMHLTGTIY